MPAKAASPAHRGRFQAQGSGVEKSVPWARETPPTVEDGLAMIDRLVSQLRPFEFEARRECIANARAFVENAARAGGVDAPASKSWSKRGGIRIDIEVLTGRAFISGPRTSED